MRQRATIILSAFLLSSALLTETGCTDEMYLDSGSNYNILTVDTVNANLILTVGNLSVSETTRSDGEKPSSANPETETDAERRVNDIWLFQYDAKSTELLYYTYVEITSPEQLENLENGGINVPLGDNGTNNSIVYAVTNTGDENWVTETNKENFSTIAKLEDQTIPNPQPIYATDLYAAGSTKAIPMSGKSEEVLVWEDSQITVPVTRMFAKLMFNAVMEVDEKNYEAKITAVSVGGVPSTCAVGTLYTGDPSNQGDYSSDTKYYPWTFTDSQILSKDDEEYEGYPYVIYVPENIKGEVTITDENTTKSDNAPLNSLNVTTYIDLYDLNYDPQVKLVADPHYAVYPGGNSTDNFNVRRNCVYRVTTDIKPSDVITASANCLIAYPGETIAFFPYVRDEIGHRDDNSDHGTDNYYDPYYDFENHLNPDDPTKTIKSVKIIWQTPDAIGNNTNTNPDYPLVWLSDETDRHKKIYVKTANEGNALIAAYDKDNPDDADAKILWSWHIWITKTYPDDVSRAITYDTYYWDENGIDNTRWVSGYPVMRCNLGALAEDIPENPTWEQFTKTYGMLYQWGRKDPFPPVKTNGKKSGVYNYDNSTAKVNVNDNSNQQIDLTGNDGYVGSGTGYEVFNTILTTSLPEQTQEGGIEYSIEHPTMFIAAANKITTSAVSSISDYINSGDWLPGSDDDLWGGNGTSGKKFQVYSYATLEDNYGEYKTIFDPCPYGWRVSPGNIWLGFTSDGLNWEYTSNDETAAANLLKTNVNCSEETAAEVASNMGFHMYMNEWKNESGEVSFFPTQGSRIASGQPYHGGICGNYHQATVDETIKNNGIDIKRVDILHIHGLSSTNFKFHTFETDLVYYVRGVAGPLRCVRDSQN